MTAPWLSIVGIGEGGLAELTPAARRLFDDAEILAGGARHLALVADDSRPKHLWTLPLDKSVAALKRLKPAKVCVLATGDPMHYGIGVTLARHVPVAEMVVVPHVSAFALACARLGWAMAEVGCLTLHGRPLERMISFVQPGARLLLLSHGGETPGQVAALLRGSGFGDSILHVLEHMGGPRERLLSVPARHWRKRKLADLNTIAVECAGGPGLSRVPGLPDDAYDHDGQITKREVRAATLAALAPVPGELLWDVGAGAGSIAIEWLRADRRNRAIAIERDPARARRIRANAAALGTPDLTLVEGTAPAALRGLERPEAIFVGGGVGDRRLLAACWRALSPGGRLVANAVTATGEAALLARHDAHGGELVRLAVSRLERKGRVDAWSALTPVTQYRGRKP